MFRWCWRQGLCVLPSSDYNVRVLPYNPLVFTLTLSCSMLLGARPVWTRFSSCTSVVRLLSYHPLCLFSYCQFFHVAMGAGLCGPGVLRVLALFACFPTTLCASSFIVSVSMLLGARPVWTGVLVYFHCSPSFLLPFVSLLLLQVFPCC